MKVLSLHFDLNNTTLHHIKAHLEYLKCLDDWLSVNDLDAINETYLERMHGYDSIDEDLLHEVESLWGEVYVMAYEQ